MTIVQPNYRQAAGSAGSVTKSGASINSFHADELPAPGIPLKLVSGKAVKLSGTEKAEEIIGIAMKRPTPFEPFYPGDMIEVVHEGFVQVPVVDGKTPVRGGAVYFDAAQQKFTTDSEGKAHIRAVWSADGQSGGIGEIQIVPYVATPSGASGIDQSTADGRYFKKADKINLTTDVTGALPVANGGSGASTDVFMKKTDKVNLTNGVSGALPIANGGTGATDATTALSNLGGQPKTE